MTLFLQHFQVWKHNGGKQPCPTHCSLGSQSTNTLHLSSTFNRRWDHNCNWMPWWTNMSLGSFSRIRSEYLKCRLCFLDTRNFLIENNSPRIIVGFIFSVKYVLTQIAIMQVDNLYYLSELTSSGFWLLAIIISTLSGLVCYV